MSECELLGAIKAGKWNLECFDDYGNCESCERYRRVHHMSGEWLCEPCIEELRAAGANLYPTGY